MSSLTEPALRLRRRWIAAALLVLTAISWVGAATGWTSPVRTGVTVVVAVLAPGWAVVALFPRTSAATEWMLAAALSILGLLGISFVMLLTGWWVPVPAFLVYGGVVAAVLALLATGLLPTTLRRHRASERAMTTASPASAEPPPS